MKTGRALWACCRKRQYLTPKEPGTRCCWRHFQFDSRECWERLEDQNP